mgnify:CR=1 FL=1
MVKKSKRNKSFLSLIKQKIKKMIINVDYYTIKNYDILVFIITNLYLMYTRDSVGAEIMRIYQQLNSDNVNKKLKEYLTDVLEYLINIGDDKHNCDNKLNN